MRKTEPKGKTPPQPPEPIRRLLFGDQLELFTELGNWRWLSPDSPDRLPLVMRELGFKVDRV